jgi:nucleoside-diphosphate-sugar epimerase
MALALVTGGAGFLGYHIAHALTEAGWTVRLLDVVDPGAELEPGQTFIRGDVRDAVAVREAAAGCEVVVDNAALVPITRARPEEFRAVNVDGCRNTLAAARAEGAYVVHISSTSIYGLPRQMPVTEESALMPFEPYGVSKADAEELVHRERADGLVVSSLRSRALLGRGRLGVFDPIFHRMRDNKLVPLIGRGDKLLQMTDARDFGAAVLACIERRANDDYNIAAAEFATPREDFQALIERVGSTSRLVPIPLWAVRAVAVPLDVIGKSPFSKWHWKAADATFYMALDKAERDLGWRPRYSNVDALERTYREWLAGAGGGSAHLSPLRGAFARVLRG